MKLNRSGTMQGEYGFLAGEDINPIAVEPVTGIIYVGRASGVDLICPL